MVKVELSFGADSYVDGWTDEKFADQTQLTEVDQAELAACVLGATKLTDGHLVVDATKRAELETPEPTEQDLINAQLMKTAAQLQLTNAALMKRVAEMEVKDG